MRLYAIALSVLIGLSTLCNEAEARRHRSHGSSHSSAHSSSRTHGSSRHHGRHHRGKMTRKAAAPKPRYAYPLDIFMLDAPHDEYTALPPDDAARIRYAFQSGSADDYSPTHLVRSGAFNFYPLRGGIFERREQVKYIIVHSTETGVPQDARRVINSWSGMGRRHPGAQYVVDRDGTIFQAVDPQYATVHVNIFKTLPGINNDNSIGIEMCHAGSQNYPNEQRQSVIRLVAYLQNKFHVTNDNVITHRYAQQGDHTDPVAFDFDEFLARKDDFRNRALAMKRPTPTITPSVSPTTAPPVVADDVDVKAPPAAVYLEVHHDLLTAPTTAAAPKFKTIAPPSEYEVINVFSAQQRPQSVFNQQNILQNSTPVVSAPKNIPLRGEIELPPSSATQVP